ncbi:MAG: hypothetical protein KH013_11595 [Clostridiales bacterium]|nr:hypothetical protein [Clostridiales bacterium]
MRPRASCSASACWRRAWRSARPCTNRCGTARRRRKNLPRGKGCAPAQNSRTARGSEGCGRFGCYVLLRQVIRAGAPVRGNQRDFRRRAAAAPARPSAERAGRANQSAETPASPVLGPRPGSGVAVGAGEAVASGAAVGAGVVSGEVLGAGVVVGAGVTVGAGVVVASGVVLGAGVVVGAGVTVGAGEALGAGVGVPSAGISTAASL